MKINRTVPAPALLLLPFILLLVSPQKMAVGAESPRLHRSAPALGRGNTGYSAPEADDALFQNPAAIHRGSSGEDPLEVKRIILLSPLLSFSGSANELMDIGSDDVKLLKAMRQLSGDPVHLGLDQYSGVRFGESAVGLIYTNRYNLFIFKDPENAGVETVDLTGVSSTGLVVGHGIRLPSVGLRLGAMLKALQRKDSRALLSIAQVDAIKNFNLGQYESKGQGYGADVGLVWRPDTTFGLRLGLVVQDVGDTTYKGNETDGVPLLPDRQTVNAGLSFQLPGPTGSMRLHLDMRDILGRQDDDVYKRLHTGATWQTLEYLGVSAGLNQGYFTAGLLLRLPWFRMDLGTYGEEMGASSGDRPSRRYFIRLTGFL